MAEVSEYARRADLDHLERSLRQDLLDTERLLRNRDDEKERGLRAEFVDAIERSDKRARDGFAEVKGMLEEQNKFIMRQRFRWVTWRRDLLGLFLAGGAASLFLHFVFRIPL